MSRSGATAGRAAPHDKEARQGDEGHEDNQYQDGRSTERGRQQDRGAEQGRLALAIVARMLRSRNFLTQFRSPDFVVYFDAATAARVDHVGIAGVQIGPQALRSRKQLSASVELCRSRVGADRHRRICTEIRRE